MSTKLYSIPPSPETNLCELRASSGERVIRSISALADTILDSGTSPYESKRTLIVTLSDVFMGKRGCPTRLLQPLMNAILSTLRQRPAIEPDEISQLLEICSQKLAAGRGVETLESQVVYACNPPDLVALNRAVLTAAYLVALLPVGIFADPSGQQIIKNACQKLGLLGKPKADNFCLEIWFGTREDALRWWLDLHGFVRTHAKENLSNDFVGILASANIKCLIVPPLAAAANLIVAEPADVRLAKGFQFTISKSSPLPTMMAMPPEYTNLWLSQVYAASRNNEPHCQFVPYLATEALSTLID